MQNKKRVNVFVNSKAHSLARKKGLNISKICSEAIENEAYEDNEDFVLRRIDEIHKNYKDDLSTAEAKLLIIKEKQEKRKQVVPQAEYLPEDRDAWLPKRKVKDSSSGGE